MTETTTAVLRLCPNCDGEGRVEGFYGHVQCPRCEGLCIVSVVVSRD